jgi:mannose-6-phosphate isomerase-like protein (cupin superfamily)
MLNRFRRTKNRKFVKRPWGGYIILEKRPGYWIKKLFINKGEQLSLQSHKNRGEVWIVLQGKIRAQKGRDFFILQKGECLRINKKEKHRISSLAGAVVLETAFGQPRESDIVRYKDKYGRDK